MKNVYTSILSIAAFLLLGVNIVFGQNEVTDLDKEIARQFIKQCNVIKIIELTEFETQEVSVISVKGDNGEFVRLCESNSKITLLRWANRDKSIIGIVMYQLNSDEPNSMTNSSITKDGNFRDLSFKNAGLIKVKALKLFIEKLQPKKIDQH